MTETPQKRYLLDASYLVYARTEQEAWQTLVDHLHRDDIPTHGDITLNTVWDALEDIEYTDAQEAQS